MRLVVKRDGSGSEAREGGGARKKGEAGRTSGRPVKLEAERIRPWYHGGTHAPRNPGAFGGSRKPQKSIFSSLETISIESGVIDLVGQYQLGVIILDF